MTFGEYFRNLRIQQEESLRKFCQENELDAGNISRLENGRMQPPRSEERLWKLGKALGLKKSSPEFARMRDLALAIKRPARHQSSFANVRDEKIRERLPDLLARLNNPSLTLQKLDDLFEVLEE